MVNGFFSFTMDYGLSTMDLRRFTYIFLNSQHELFVKVAGECGGRVCQTAGGGSENGAAAGAAFA